MALVHILFFVAYVVFFVEPLLSREQYDLKYRLLPEEDSDDESIPAEASGLLNLRNLKDANRVLCIHGGWWIIYIAFIVSFCIAALETLCSPVFYDRFGAFVDLCCQTRLSYLEVFLGWQPYQVSLFFAGIALVGLLQASTSIYASKYNVPDRWYPRILYSKYVTYTPHRYIILVGLAALAVCAAFIWGSTSMENFHAFSLVVAVMLLVFGMLLMSNPSSSILGKILFGEADGPYIILESVLVGLGKMVGPIVAGAILALGFQPVALGAALVVNIGTSLLTLYFVWEKYAYVEGEYERVLNLQHRSGSHDSGSRGSSTSADGLYMGWDDVADSPRRPNRADSLSRLSKDQPSLHSPGVEGFSRRSFQDFITIMSAANSEDSNSEHEEVF
jgi:hypothetical protein